MRTLTANALAQIATNKGTEPVNIFEVQWVKDGPIHAYADRDIGVIQGRILDLSALDTVITTDGGSESQQISVTLSDVDGALKNIFDTHDIHKRPVWVYQWFAGMDLIDKFQLFTGTINSPIVWNEADRTLSFEVMTKIEDSEVGFSAEEGQFPQIPDSLIGRPWPLAFGTVLDMPALRLNKTVQGTTQEGVGIISGSNLIDNVFTGNEANEISFGQSMAAMSIQISVLAIAAQQWFNIGGLGSEEGAALQDQANSIRANQAAAVAAKFASELQTQTQRQTRKSTYTSPTNVGPSTIHILGGEDFPQGVAVEVEIGNGGLFTGIFDCQEFRILSRRHEENEAHAEEQVSFTQPSESTIVPGQFFDISAQGPFGPVRRHGLILGGEVSNRVPVNQVAQQYWAEPGSTVKLVSDVDQNYIVSIVPGTVLAVKAYKRFEGVRRLVNVPTDLWSQVDVNYGDITAVTVRLTKQLSGIPDQGWEDELYVTFESDIGPNTVDIMQYLIETYSDLSIDTASFTTVFNYLEPFPSNFALFERKQIIQLLDEIGFQSRTAVFIKDNTVHLRYLPVEPTSVQTITTGDVSHKSMSISLTDTEDLVTKMIVTWRPTYADDDERKMVLRHNVQKYGIQERTFDWYIYNQPDIIRKAATFWIIRLANTWKKVQFKGYLNLLNIETFDGVTLSLAPFIGPVLSLVEKATYDSATNEIDFECWTPIKAGTTVQYPFAWPYARTEEFPAPGDLAGSDFSVTGDLPVGSLELGGDCPDAGGIIIGGPNIVFVGPADRGDPRPADTGFVAQPMIPTGTDFNLVVVPKPQPNLAMIYAPQFPVPDVPQIKQSQSIDIAKTLVVDSNRPETQTTLDSILRFDEESQAYAARRAYLAED